MSFPMILFAIILIVCSVALVTIVLLQTNRGSEMSALTGKGPSSVRGQTAKRDMTLKRLTIVFGLVFVVAVFLMNIVISVGIA